MRAVGSNPRQAAEEEGAASRQVPGSPAPPQGGPTGLGPGIGPTLRKARLSAGKSIEEASREMHVREDLLRALERERFQELMGDVYVRGFLRSYATYLGVDPAGLLEAYETRYGGLHEETEDSPVTPTPTRRLVPRRLRHPSWGLLVGVALGILALFAAFGLLSRSKATPPATAPPSPNAQAQQTPPRGVTVGIQATEAVQAVVVADGQVVFDGTLREGESRSFEASRTVEVRLDRGGVALFTIDGVPIGTLGRKNRPFTRSFGPEDAAALTPTPTPSATAGGARRSPSGNSP